MRLSMLISLAAIGCGEKAGVSVTLTEADADCTWYKDADGDGYADPFDSIEDACDAAPEGAMAAAEGMWDCDDSNADVKPGEEEVCGDELDNDCDGTVDNDCDFEPNEGTWNGTNFDFDPDGCQVAVLFGLDESAEVAGELTLTEDGFDLSVWGGDPTGFALDRLSFSGTAELVTDFNEGGSVLGVEIESLDAKITQTSNITGVFASATEASVQLVIEGTCEGEDCTTVFGLAGIEGDSCTSEGTYDFNWVDPDAADTGDAGDEEDADTGDAEDSDDAEDTGEAEDADDAEDTGDAADADDGDAESEDTGSGDADVGEADDAAADTAEADEDGAEADTAGDGATESDDADSSETEEDESGDADADDEDESGETESGDTESGDVASGDTGE